MARSTTVNHTTEELGSSIRNYTINQTGDPGYVLGMRKRLTDILSGDQWNNALYNEAKGLKQALLPYTPETLRGGVGRQADTYNIDLVTKLEPVVFASDFKTYILGAVKNGKTVTVRFGKGENGELFQMLAVGNTPTEPTEVAKAARAARKAARIAKAAAAEQLRIDEAVKAAVAKRI